MRSFFCSSADVPDGANVGNRMANPCAIVCDLPEPADGRSAAKTLTRPATRRSAEWRARALREAKRFRRGA